MSKKYYVSYDDLFYYVYRPNGDILTRAATVDNAKYICAELNQLLHRIPTPEPAPKYDPCRMFRKGDRVRINSETVYGRKVFFEHADFQAGEVYTVAEDENEYGTVLILSKNDTPGNFHHLDIDLVTRAEENGLYYIRNNKKSKKFEVRDRKKLQIVATFCYSGTNAHTQIEAQKAALDYCERLNAEHRKEQK